MHEVGKMTIGMLRFSRCWLRRVVVPWRRLSSSSSTLRASSVTDASRPTRRNISSWCVLTQPTRWPKT